jgi:hypothetical protein
MDQQQVYALATLAGFKNCGYEKIRNDYWPSHSDYDHLREQYPWWIVTTEFGSIRIGYRKRVIHIDWINTNRRGVVTEDDVTKDDYMVHAWNLGTAVTYLKAIATLPIVDVTLAEFNEYHVTSYSDIVSIVKDFGNVTPEHLLMTKLLETIDPDVMPTTLTFCRKKEGSEISRYTLHIGTFRIEWVSKRS